MPTQRDIAEQLGVSVATVSLALRRDPQISREMQVRVREMAEALGYTYHPRRNPSTSSIRLAFVTSYNVTDIFYAQVLDAAEKESQQHGATLRFVQAARVDPLSSIHDLDELDGVLLIGTFGAATVRALARRGVPSVLVDNDVPGTPQDRVLIENEVSVGRMVHWLHGQGHRRIAYVHGPDAHLSFRERLRGYELAMRELGLAPLVLSAGDVQGEITFERTTQHFAAYLASRRALPFTAVVACLDKAAIGVLRALQAVGFRVPQDVSVVGFDDIDAASVIIPALTTNRVYRDLLGRMGVRLLLERIADARYPSIRVMIGTELIERESAGPAPVAPEGSTSNQEKEVLTERLS